VQRFIYRAFPGKKKTIYFWLINDYIRSCIFPVGDIYTMQPEPSPTVFSELSKYPWCGLYSILKASHSEIPGDTMQYFALLDLVRGVVGKNRAWRGRLVHQEMMRCLVFFKCDVEYTKVSHMSLERWVRKCGALNSRYIMFITGHFVYLTIGETLSDLKMYDQIGAHDMTTQHGAKMSRKMVRGSYLVQEKHDELVALTDFRSMKSKQWIKRDRSNQSRVRDIKIRARFEKRIVLIKMARALRYCSAAETQMVAKEHENIIEHIQTNLSEEIEEEKMRLFDLQ